MVERMHSVRVFKWACVWVGGGGVRGAALFSLPKNKVRKHRKRSAKSSSCLSCDTWDLKAKPQARRGIICLERCILGNGVYTLAKQ